MSVRLATFVERADRLGLGREREFGLASPLINLATALDALAEGKTASMLKKAAPPAERGRGSELEFHTLWRRMPAAAALHILTADPRDGGAGMDRKPAAAAVVKALAGTTVFARSKAKPADALLDWREVILQLNEKRTIDELPAHPPPRTYVAAAFNTEVAGALAAAKAKGMSPAQVRAAVLHALKMKVGAPRRRPLSDSPPSGSEGR